MPTDPRGLRADAPLLNAWLSFQESQIHPFTIPGHKQRRDLVGDVVAGDVPLYAGLDTMKLTAGVLEQAQHRAAALWGADRAYFSVGGSTHGNQALALALGRPGDIVVITRSAHRSLVSALVLTGLVPHWVAPTVDAESGMPQPISPAALAAACATAQLRASAEGSAVAGVLLTDPAYVGTHGDVAAWAEISHRHGVPLLIDAAWAAHFGFHPSLPPHAVAAGADAVVTSAHKVLPAYSQGALILVRGTRIDPQRLAAAVELTHTTSPAGAILASVDAARALLARDGRELLDGVLGALAAVRARLKEVAGLRVLEGSGIDPLKLVLVLAGTGADGNAVEGELITAGHPVELADRDTLVAMVTLADSPAVVERFGDQLIAAIERHRGTPRRPAGLAAYTLTPVPVITPREAYFAEAETVPAAAAVGRVGVELIAPYPPGIPVLAPGELITPEVMTALESARASAARIAYAADATLATLRVAAAPVPQGI